ncbi:hypothetical protein AAG906_010522 [Vitis piasezkii]
MGFSGVNLSALRIKKGTNSSVDALGNRTMRPVSQVLLRFRYGIYNLEVIHAAVQMAKQEGVFVSLDLASFEV